MVPDYPVKGVNFWDMNSLFAGPAFKDTIDCLVKNCQYVKSPTHIVGIESRGFTIGGAVAYAMDLPFVMLRKSGSKYPGELLTQSYDLEYGEDTLVLQSGLLGHCDRVIILDDLIATGGSMDAAEKLVIKTGAKYLCGVTVVNLRSLRRRKDQVVYSVINEL